ncbi:MAG: SrtB family sortase, partial [Clostridiaceae bacterium]|nr:SrtB family sortase [Clostridiaceae bacterium]
PDRAFDLEIFAVMLVTASDNYIFEPQHWQTDDIDELLTYVQENAMFLHKETAEAFGKSNYPQLLALSTCSAEYTNARTILLAAMVSH